MRYPSRVIGLCRAMFRYNLLAVPVVSADERLVGIITVDDTLERLLPPERRRKLPIPAIVSLDDV